MTTDAKPPTNAGVRLLLKISGMLARWRSSLRYAVILALAIGLLVPMTLVHLYDTHATHQAALEDLHRDLSHTSKVMALSLAEPVWQVSPDLAEPIVKAQFDDPRFIHIQVMESSDEQPFLTHGRPQKPGEHDLTLSETRAILRGNREIAWLTISMSAAPQLEIKQSEMLVGLLRSLLTLTVSSILILWVLRVFVLKPMTKLTQAAEALAAGRLEQPLALRAGGDEISRMGMAMERMRQALLQAFGALREHASTLEETVRQRTAELTGSNEELLETLTHLKQAQHKLVESEKLASLGRLVAGIAHELNTPLGNSLTVVSALEDRFRQLENMLNGNEPMRRSLLVQLVRDTRHGQDILHRNVQKAADLVRDFKQVSMDQTTDMRRTFDLAKIVEDVIVMVEPSFRPSPFIIDTDLAPGLKMNGFPGSLGQVLTNLLMNALIHAFEGRDKGRVLVRCARLSDTEVELSVGDDGNGMGEDVRRRIFDPFFTTKLGTGGSGLGMHIVHNIVINVLGGQIEVRSNPGQGTQMHIQLPITAPTQVTGEKSKYA